MFGITTSYSTGLPALDEQDDFRCARPSQIGQCLTGRLARKRSPRSLVGQAALAAEMQAWVRHAVEVASR